MNLSEELSKFESGSEEYKFFKSISEKLNDDCIRKSVAQNVKEAHNTLNKAMQKYFESYILSNAVKKSVDQCEVDEEACSTPYKCIRGSETNIHSLYINLIKKHLPVDKESDDFKLFGLTQVDVLNALEKQKKSEVKHAAFKELVEKNINDFCQKLITCTGCEIYSIDNWKEVFNKTIKDLESKVSLLSIEESNQQSEKQLKDMIKMYYEELSKGVMLLSKLLALHEQKLEFESVVVENYLQRCQTVNLKMQIFRLKILEATYNQDTIPALRIISNELDNKEEQLKAEENIKTVALESYLKLGDEYESFVDEYAQLTKKVKEQQWAIDELIRSAKPKSST